ncbi:MAG TPA: hypothetical protein VM120_18515 [Bryobacteraceae bacterium]|nr:hypothetical protein [Bryobacteraceae bacterium]
MSRALREEVRWNAAAVTSVRWRNFPVYQFGEPLPVVEMVLINRLDAGQMGAGECSITASASAIGNAVFDATGVRLRQIPLTPARVLAALATRA